MSGTVDGSFDVRLEGELVVERVAHLQRALTEKLAQMECAPAAPAMTLDFGAVTDLDACCCQLLALFMKSARRRGVTPVARGIGPELAQRVALMGFSAALATGEAA